MGFARPAGMGYRTIVEAMNGDKTFRVNLSKPIPVLILYGTASLRKPAKSTFPTIFMG